MADQLRALVGDLWRLNARWDGVYIALEDGSKRLAWANSTRNRIGGGETFVRPELRDVDPFPAPGPAPYP